MLRYEAGSTRTTSGPVADETITTYTTHATSIPPLPARGPVAAA